MSSYLIFITVCLGLIMSGINQTMIAVAFPVITSSFDVSIVQASWILSIFQLAWIAAMPFSGKACELFGTRRVWLTSLIFFTVGSILCAVAPNIQFLIFFRFIQGLGAGAYIPAAIAITAETFPNKRQQFIGLISSIFPIGNVIGPNLGGWLVSSFSWRYAFWFNVPISIIIFILSVALMKPGAQKKGKIDFAGTGLITACIFTFIIGFSMMGKNTIVSSDLSLLYSGLLLALGIILVFILIRHISKSQNPILDMQILRNRPFMAANIYNFIIGACFFGISSYVPLYAVSVFFMTTRESGLVMTPMSIGTIITSAITSFLLLRWGYRKPMVIGTSVVAVALLLMGSIVLGIREGSILIISGTIFIVGIGMGTFMPASNNACIELMPDRVASISSARTMFRNIGGSLGIAVISVVLDNASDISTGFMITFFGLAGLILIAIPFIFLMPKSPFDSARIFEPKTTSSDQR